MNRRVLFITILSMAAFSTAALCRDLSPPSAPAPARDYSIEIFDQNKTIKIACDGLEFGSRPSELSNGDDSNFLLCTTSVDGTTADLLDYVSKGMRLERVLALFGQQKGYVYKMELLNVLVADLNIQANESLDAPHVNLNFSSAKSRLVRAPE
jgi:hypothetical protein